MTHASKRTILSVALGRIQNAIKHPIAIAKNVTKTRIKHVVSMKRPKVTIRLTLAIEKIKTASNKCMLNT